MNERRVHRLRNQIRARVAAVLQQELADPRLGFVTVSRVELDRENSICKIFWSTLGNEKERKLSGAALDRASGFVRRAIAQVIHTRSVPQVQFLFDESIEGAVRMDRMLADLRTEREQREAAAGPPPEQDEPEPGSAAEDRSATAETGAPTEAPHEAEAEGS